MAVVNPMILVMISIMMIVADAGDTNDVFSPCADAQISKGDGFTFGLAFSSKDFFFHNEVQLSPCDSRLALADKGAQLAMFRPKVDEISLLTVNSTQFSSSSTGKHVVAFAGRKYAARSVPVVVSDNTHIINSFTLVLEFQKGTLQNLYWKNLGCDSCHGDSLVCLNQTSCAVPLAKCGGNGGNVDCNISIQLAFSGTDKNLEALNSWYEVSNLRQYSLYGLYSKAMDSLNII